MSSLTTSLKAVVTVAKSQPGLPVTGFMLFIHRSHLMEAGAPISFACSSEPPSPSSPTSSRRFLHVSHLFSRHLTLANIAFVLAQKQHRSR